MEGGFLDDLLSSPSIKQLYFFLLGFVALGCLVYQYWDQLVYLYGNDPYEPKKRLLSRSRSRSPSAYRSHSSARVASMRNARRGRNSKYGSRRCPDCGFCKLEIKP